MSPKRFTVASKLQALVYDILPWRKVLESDARSVSGKYSAILCFRAGPQRSSMVRAVVSWEGGGVGGLNWTSWRVGLTLMRFPGLEEGF